MTDKIFAAIAEIRRAMNDKLKESGLTSKDASILHFVPLTREQLPIKHPELTSTPLGGFEIPYFSPDKKRTDFFRYRFLEQPNYNGFAALIKHKPIRYIQPSSVPPQAYFPPSLDWIKTLSDAKERLFITEGELKAASACKLGIATIGLGGVWNFKSARARIDFLPELAEIDWEHRIVYIVYDSDATTNPDVLKAEHALATNLLNLKAEVYLVRLPSLEPGKKTGLDDFLVSEGREEFIKLVDKAEEWSVSRELHRLNSEVVVVEDPGIILNLDTFQRMGADIFTRIVYADRFYYETAGKRIEKKEAAKEWLKWPGRGAVSRVTYLPGVGRHTEAGEFNVWPGWNLPEEVIKPGDVSLPKKLINFLFAGEDSSAIKWFEQWLAYPLQYPGTKLYTAVVMWGKQGTGKSFMGNIMTRMYGRNATTIGNRELESSFNDWMENKQFVIGDEIKGGDKRQFADALKGIITQLEVRINAKYIKPYTIPDCVNYYFTSNNPDSFFLHDDDRRFFVIEVQGEPLSDEFYSQLDRWYRSDKVGAWIYYLMHLNLEGFDYKAKAPYTASKREMVELGRSEHAAWINQLMENPESVLGPARKHWTVASLKELYGAFRAEYENSRVNTAGFKLGLKEVGIQKLYGGKPVKTWDGSKRLWAFGPTAKEILNKYKTPGEIGKLYVEQHGEEPKFRRKQNDS